MPEEFACLAVFSMNHWPVSTNRHNHGTLQFGDRIINAISEMSENVSNSNKIINSNAHAQAMCMLCVLRVSWPPLLHLHVVFNGLDLSPTLFWGGFLV